MFFKKLFCLHFKVIFVTFFVRGLYGINRRLTNDMKTRQVRFGTVICFSQTLLYVSALLLSARTVQVL